MMGRRAFWAAPPMAVLLTLTPTGAPAQIPAVVSGAPLWTAGAGWRLSPTPVLELGSSGAPVEEFGDVRALARLADGSVVVADRMAGELRLFGPDGRFLRTMGGLGEGPGEFKGVSSLQLLGGDSIAAFDFPLRRWTVFTASGDLLETRTFRHSELPGVASAYRHADGDFTVAGAILVSPGGPAGYSDLKTPLYRVHATDDRLTPLGEIPAQEVYRTESGGLGRALALRRGARVVGDRIFVGDGREWEVRVLDREGAPVATWRRVGVDLSLDPARLRAAEEASLAPMQGNPDALARWRRLYAEVPRRRTLPAFSRFLLDGEGFLWVAGYSLPGEPTPPWSVFNPQGRYLGDVAVPHRFEILAVDDQHVLGVWRDDFDVQVVRVYALEGR